MGLRAENLKMVGKLAVVAAGMFAFGYAMIPLYRAICEATGINIPFDYAERQVPGNGSAGAGSAANTQVDRSRVVTVEFDANARGLWQFKPALRSLEVHPGELATVMYEFQNVQDRRMAAQAIPSYAPRQAAPYFQQAGVLLLQPVHAGAGREETVAGGRRRRAVAAGRRVR